MKLISTLFVLITLSGCSLFEKETKTDTIYQDLRTRKIVELDSTGVHVSQLGFMMNKTELNGRRIEHIKPSVLDSELQFANSLINFEFVGFYAKNKYHIIPYYIKNTPNNEAFTHHFYLVKASGFYTLNKNGNLEFKLDLYLILTKDGTVAKELGWRPVSRDLFPKFDYDKSFGNLTPNDTVEFVLMNRKVTEKEFNLTKQSYRFRVEGNKVIVEDVSKMYFYSGLSQNLLPRIDKVQLLEYGNILDTIIFNSPYHKIQPNYPYNELLESVDSEFLLP
jgi:hypothetical protein